MNTETQTLIITILGLDSIIALVGLYLIVVFTQQDTTLLLALVPLVTTPAAIIGGFLTGKSGSEISETVKNKIIEEYNANNENSVEVDEEAPEVSDGDAV